MNARVCRSVESDLENAEIRVARRGRGVRRVIDRGAIRRPHRRLVPHTRFVRSDPSDSSGVEVPHRDTRGIGRGLDSDRECAAVDAPRTPSRARGTDKRRRGDGTVKRNGGHRRTETVGFTNAHE